jgi:hypothetical protein
MALLCTRPRLEAALGAEPPSVLCPLREACELARSDCRVFAPGWWCEDREIVVFPELLLDSDFEPEPLEDSGDDEPDDDYT